MKILYLHQYFKFPNETGGTRSYDLAHSFIANGHSVEVITSTSNPIFKHNKKWITIDKDNLRVHYIYLPYSNELPNWKRIIVFYRFLYNSTHKLLSLEGDIVLATSTPLTIGIPALLKKWINKTPYIFEVRDVWPEAVIAIGAIKNSFLKKALHFLEKVIYKNAAAIVPLSTDMKHSILSRYPAFSKKTIEVIENISEINRFQDYIDQEHSILKEKLGLTPRFSILYAGTFGRVNGLQYVVELAEKTLSLDKGLVYILIGTGAEKVKILQLANDKGLLGKNVFIFDPISKDALPQWYHEVNMGSSFVIEIKELWANSANKFFDTLAAAKPILINHEGWQKDIIQRYNVGYVLPVKLDEQSVNMFVEYTHDNELIDRQKRNALQLAKEKYSLEVAAAKYDAIFQKINEKGSG